MWEIEYSDSNYTDFIQTIAGVLNIRAREHFLHIPSYHGEGFMYAMNLANGISILFTDAVLNKDIILHRLPDPNYQYFILQINEAIHPENNKNNLQNSEAIDLAQNAVLLTNSFMHSKFIIPKNVRLRSVKMIFEKKQLLGIFSAGVVDAFTAKYFSLYFKQSSNDPIDAEYRQLVNKLLKESDNHPMKYTFIYNRIMLLLEKFFSSFMNKMQHSERVIKMKEDVISRLIKVEATLVKDYYNAPPVIEKLANIASMSATKLKKDFKTVYGLPIYEYYQKNRMMHAKTLLLEEKYPVKEVGRMVGYTNLGHFAASFKKEFGILPSEVTNHK